MILLAVISRNLLKRKSYSKELKSKVAQAAIKGNVI